MAGALTRYLQEQFPHHLPRGWVCRREQRLVGRELSRFLGYSPAVDLLLEPPGDTGRIWVEFEVSRADPVANHAKFASSRLFCTDLKDDTFVSMVSPHVARGRRNLASSAIYLLRGVGLRAFQTALLPQIPADAIKRLNHMAPIALDREGPDVGAEADRLCSIVRPVLETEGHRIHFASDPFEVVVNAERWNQEMARDEGRKLWGRRHVSYFVYSPATGRFAPSKFCAFVPVGGPSRTGPRAEGPEAMSVGLYCRLDETETRFDGRIAWKHLRDHLGFKLVEPKSGGGLDAVFELWAKEQATAIEVQNPKILVPPEWFCGRATWRVLDEQDHARL